MRTGPLLVVVLLISPAADAADPTRLYAADATLIGEWGDYAGSSVSGAGDVNGDGKADVLVGAPGYGVLDPSASGSAYLLSGPITGRTDISLAAVATFVGQVDDHAGYAVSGAGDMDGDGTADVVIGAPGNDGATGVAYLVLGPVSGTIDLALADGFLVGENPLDHTGFSVADAGDVDGDGHDDLLVAAGANRSPTHLGPESLHAGAAYLVLGPVTGTFNLASADAKLSGAEDDLGGREVGGSDYAGDYVSGAGDVDADGHDDLLVGVHLDDSNGTASGAAYLVLGPVWRDINLSRAADAELIGEREFDFAGFSVSDAGDVDGDGHDDVLVGAPFNEEGGRDAGAAYLLLGPVTGRLSLNRADAKLVGERAGDWAGGSVSSAGDVNGDGLADIIVGAPNKLWEFRPERPPTHPGGAYVVLGPVSGHVDLSLAAAELVGVESHRHGAVGSAVSSAGDEDGDGFDDIVIGAWRFTDTLSDTGAVYVLSGAGL